MKEYHIVYAADHNFAFICAVAVASLLRHKKEDDSYVVHILSDGTFVEEDRELFSRLQEEYSMCSIVIEDIVDEAIENVDMSNTYLTKMTFYRLLLPSLLRNVDKCIYLDADTIVCDDISLLMEHNVDDYYIAAVVDRDIRKVQYNNIGNFNLDEYFNAGVMLMNLERIREHNLEEQFFSLIDIEWPFRDQDILNQACRENVLFLDERFNRFSYLARNKDDSVIVHFLGDAGMRPWIYLRANLSDDWWETASFFKDTQHYRELRKEVEDRHNRSTFRYVLAQCRRYKNVYIFGSGFYGRKLVRCLKVNRVSNIRGVIDNNENLWSNTVGGLTIISPGEVEYNEDNCYLISVSNNSIRDKIKVQLISLGAKEERILFYEENPPEYYYYISPQYLSEAKEDVLLRELGTGTNRLGWE